MDRVDCLSSTHAALLPLIVRGRTADIYTERYTIILIDAVGDGRKERISPPQQLRDIGVDHQNLFARVIDVPDN